MYRPGGIQVVKVEDFKDPYLGTSWRDLGARVLSSGNRVAVHLGYPAAGLQSLLGAELAAFLGVPAIELDLRFAPAEKFAFNRVRNVVAVASGKGGVGKSTTAVNLALALDREGARVGLLDADIYGPSQGMMLGVPQDRRPELRDGQTISPIKAHGLKTMSMSYMVTDRTPMVWRGPMASSALQQMLMQTDWGELDYLVVDMPPGTGDIQLTLSQRVPVSGAVIVTTPQDIALLDARKGIEMFNKVNIPVLGIVENMSFYRCPNCGHEAHLFGEGGGARVAGELGVPLLAALPLDLAIREQADGGNPTVAADPDGDIAGIYRNAARHLAARLWGGLQASAPVISMSDE
ncbi:MAG: iron-sulfur cluster carrier protein ApbC [Pseudomonadales bacterium]|nr:iron-sulfur cluster carrier protein ApbC [Pseudomonadales bacterium]MCP5182412.1 iron-sulfur cluster carrier protein ApbC [Pseudomonadales bacterium]